MLSLCFLLSISACLAHSIEPAGRNSNLGKNFVSYENLTILAYSLKSFVSGSVELGVSIDSHTITIQGWYRNTILFAFIAFNAKNVDLYSDFDNAT